MRTHQQIMRAGLAVLLPALAATMPVPSTAQTPGLSAEQRLQRAEDDLAIRRILVDYSATQDAHDYDGYVALFAREGEWINGKTVRKGAAQIKAMLVGIYGETAPDYVNTESFHLTTNIQVDVHGNRATARSRHLLILRRPDGSPVPALAGRYEDDLIREDGTWKILRRVDYPVMPTPAEWGKIMQERRTAK